MDDDGGDNFEEYYKNSLNANSYTFDYWDVSLRGEVPLNIINQYRSEDKSIIWFSGNAREDNTLNANDRSNLAAFLEGGGRFFISGQDIGYDLKSGFDSDTTWYKNYLYAQLINDNANLINLIGNPEDYIGNSLTFSISGGDGADNQSSPSQIKPIAPAVPILSYQGGSKYQINRRLLDGVSAKFAAANGLLTNNGSTETAALRVNTDVYKLVYFAFGFEAINTLENRNIILKRILDYLTINFSLTVNIDPPEGGFVSLSPNRQKYDIGEQVTLIAEPNENYEFSNWSGDSLSTDSLIVMSMNDNKLLTAHFKIKSIPDTSAPSIPINLSANPDYWAKENTFNINWTNPYDSSGIAAAWYKLSSLPSSNNDGARTIDKPFIVTATEQGGQPIYVWLEDSVGNKDFNNCDSTILYWDATAPTGSISINHGSDTTYSLIVNLNLNANDNMSGMEFMRLKNDNGFWSSWENYAGTKNNWDLSSNGGNSYFGMKTVFVQYKDAIGNKSDSLFDNIFYQIPSDTMPPQPPLNLAADPSFWKQTNFFSINWTNPNDSSGIAAAWYKQSSQPTSNNDGTRTTDKPFHVSATEQGSQPIYVWLEDSVGNKDFNNCDSTILFWDATSPTGLISINNGSDTTNFLKVNLNLNANDNMSGMGSGAGMQFSNNSVTWSLWEPYSTTKENWDLSSLDGDSTLGIKTIYVQYKDVVGNQSDSFSDSIIYYPIPTDTIPPPPPINLAATPNSWTSTNLFSLNWINPTDPSGIAAAWYKLSSPPNSSSDGTRTTEKPFSVSATTQGGQTIYVWLENSAGNKDKNNSNYSTIFWDVTPPTGTIVINDEDASTESLIAILKLNSFDNMSGMGAGAQMQFSNDNITWSPWEPFDTTKTNWDLSLFGGNVIRGTKTVYVSFKDTVGNKSVPYSDDIQFLFDPFKYIKIEPNILNFDKIPLGANSEKDFLIENTGSSIANFIAPSIAGNNANEFLTIDMDSSYSIDPGSFQNIMIQFKPISAGEKLAFCQLKLQTYSDIKQIELKGKSEEQSTCFCFPNPFDPKETNVQISFNLKDNSIITLKILDDRGDLVKETEYSNLISQSNWYTISWNGKNEIGDWVANGVYFYQIESQTSKKLWGKICVMKKKL